MVQPLMQPLDFRELPLEEMQARITAIAGIHRRLYTSDDVRFVEIDAYLKSLIEELQAAIADAKVQPVPCVARVSMRGLSNTR